MEGIMTVRDLREQLMQYEDEDPVMIAVVKYPAEFRVKADLEGQGTWMDGTDVEVHPIEEGEITKQGSMVVIAVELESYEAQRHAALG